jgi:Mn2+/Fe2+ NRAMP family transporter
VPVAIILWYLTVFQSFGTIKRIFLIMSLAFVAYLITGIFVHPDWGAVLKGTFVPQISMNFASISAAVALLGATVSPYTMFWQVQGEKEQQRPGTRRQQFREAALDIGSGTVSGNLVAYFIIVCTSATLFAHHQSISTAADAARALEPLAGPFATYLFAIGLIGAGLVAIPVLLASTSYGLSGTIGWDASLWKKPWQAEGFYLILTGALGVSLLLALLRFDPIQLMFGANVLQGMLSPVLVVFLLLVGNNRRIMHKERLSRLSNILLVLTAALMFAATALLLVGLVTGHSS